MRALVIETSGGYGELALADETGITATRTLSTARKHARDLVPQIREMLQEQGWRPRELDVLAVDVGPGSYTGLRVGLATVKTIAYVNQARVLAVDTMTVVASQAPASAQRVHVTVDAQQGCVYSAVFQRQDGKLRREGGVEIQPAEQWASIVAEGDFVTGPAVDRCQRLLPDHCLVAAEELRQPHAAILWLLAKEKLQQGESDDPWTLEPLYLRASSAEIKWSKRQAESRDGGE